MPFHFIRLLDHIFGKFLLLALLPLCGLIAHFLPPQRQAEPATITVLKLHGGGSLLIALPALLGIRAQYPRATITLIGTQETQKYAELTGVFDRYVLIDAGSMTNLMASGLQALRTSFRHDVFIDLEPHSFLAAVFSPLTFAARRIGFVQAQELSRAHSYTDAIYFNLNAPVHIFYEQVAALLGASPAPDEACKAATAAAAPDTPPLLPPSAPRPAIYISAFTSSLSPERMMPATMWIEQLRQKFGTAPLTLIIGGGPQETGRAREFESLVNVTLPTAFIVQACGKRTLKEAIVDIASADEFWGVDSGPLHIARLLGKRCMSFWGPSNPAFRLRPIAGLKESVYYSALPCSPCVHLSATAPCKGNNHCMNRLFAPAGAAPILRL